MDKIFTKYLTETERIDLRNAILTWLYENKIVEFQDKKMSLILHLTLEDLINEKTLQV
jgi:hypothetical protein